MVSPARAIGAWKSAPGQPTGRKTDRSRCPASRARTPFPSRSMTTSTAVPNSWTARANSGWKYGLSSCAFASLSACHFSRSASASLSSATTSTDTV